MRVLVATTAGPGHFAGLLPFARACVDLGHDVRVAAPQSFAATVRGAGLDHVVLADADPAAMGAVFARLPDLPAEEADDLVVREVFGRLDVEASLPAMREVVRQWRPHVVLREPAELSSYVAAQEAGVEHVLCNIGLDRLEDRIGPLVDAAVADLGVDPTARTAARRWTTVPPSFDVPAQRAATAPTAARDAGAPAPAPDLPDWWPDRERPLLYVTFGSVAAGIGLFPALYRAVLEQLADLPVRVLLTLGAAGDPAELGAVPEHVHVERFWPQEAVLPHASGVVGHGGFGTTVGALLAGVPQVVLPLFSFDQAANAERVAETGVGVALADPDARQRPGTELVPHGPRAVARLAGAVSRVLEDRTIRERAVAVAAEAAGLPSTHDCVAALAEDYP